MSFSCSYMSSSSILTTRRESVRSSRVVALQAAEHAGSTQDGVQLDGVRVAAPFGLEREAELWVLYFAEPP